MVIIFCGVLGTGKSTVAKLLYKRLKEKGAKLLISAAWLSLFIKYQKERCFKIWIGQTSCPSFY